jgi:hypothetical protein
LVRKFHTGLKRYWAQTVGTTRNIFSAFCKLCIIKVYDCIYLERELRAKNGERQSEREKREERGKTLRQGRRVRERESESRSGTTAKSTSTAGWIAFR